MTEGVRGGMWRVEEVDRIREGGRGGEGTDEGTENW